MAVKHRRKVRQVVNDLYKRPVRRDRQTPKSQSLRRSDPCAATRELSAESGCRRHHRYVPVACIRDKNKRDEHVRCTRRVGRRTVHGRIVAVCIVGKFSNYPIFITRTPDKMVSRGPIVRYPQRQCPKVSIFLA